MSKPDPTDPEAALKAANAARRAMQAGVSYLRALEERKAAAIAACEAGVPETTVARLARVSKMTLRKWEGKT